MEGITCFNKLKYGKYSEPNNIPTEAIKEVKKAASAYQLEVSNDLLKAQVLPPRWKVAKDILLSKSGKLQEISSPFRTICLLNIIGNVYGYQNKKGLGEGTGMSRCTFGAHIRI